MNKPPKWKFQLYLERLCRKLKIWYVVVRFYFVSEEKKAEERLRIIRRAEAELEKERKLLEEAERELLKARRSHRG